MVDQIETRKQKMQEDCVALLKTWVGKPPEEQELCQRLGLEGPEAVLWLREWEQEGLIVCNRKGGYGLPAQWGYVAGRVQRNAKGFAFLVTDAQEDDLFIPANGLGGAMHGDFVLANLSHRPHADNRRQECEVVRVLKRAHTQVVGRYEPTSQGGYVVCDEARLGSDVFIAPRYRNGAQKGDKVVCRILRYAGQRKDAQGEITEVLGGAGDAGVDVLAIIRSKKLPDGFPDPVLREAAQMPKRVTKEARAARLDLRQEVVVTIDGADSKDFDDAVSIRKTAGGWQLGVHIADVSAYVREGSALDKEALARGNSVYLLDRVLPMLPESLSNGICSLNPDVDRLTLSCIMELDAAGQVLRADLAQSVIHSHARLTYDEVNDLLEKQDAETARRLSAVAPALQEMQRLAAVLYARRVERGALNLDIPEPAFRLDETGHCVEVTVRARGTAHKMIEEFMLAANETVAAFLDGREIPTIYRVHEDPSQEKMEDLDLFVRNFNLKIEGVHKGVKPKALQQVLEAVQGQPAEGILSRVLLRSLQKARYAPENKGHFGLAAQNYCHFTSPIRRYSDLVVHRCVKAVLEGRVTGPWLEQMRERVPDWAQQCSEREVVAVEAERAVDDLKMTEYMADHVGEAFQGVISGVTEFGLFVELPCTVEGLVHITNLDDDFYVYDEKQYALIGRRRRKVYRLGDPARVRVVKADVDTRKIDFELLAEQPS